MTKICGRNQVDGLCALEMKRGMKVKVVDSGVLSQRSSKPGPFAQHSLQPPP